MELVHEELERIINHCITKEYRRFPKLVERIKEVVSAKVSDSSIKNLHDFVDNRTNGTHEEIHRRSHCQRTGVHQHKTSGFLRRSSAGGFFSPFKFYKKFRLVAISSVYKRTES